MIDNTQGAPLPTAGRPWWVATAALLLCLYAIWWLPGLVITLEWPSGQYGNLLFFGPQFLFPFALTHVGVDGQMLTQGFKIDIAVWVVIAIGFGLLTHGMRGWIAACTGLLTILGSTAILHGVISTLGWTFYLDGP